MGVAVVSWICGSIDWSDGAGGREGVIGGGGDDATGPFAACAISPLPRSM